MHWSCIKRPTDVIRPESSDIRCVARFSWRRVRVFVVNSAPQFRICAAACYFSNSSQIIRPEGMRISVFRRFVSLN